jgi:hypothetical protein
VGAAAIESRRIGTIYGTAVYDDGTGPALYAFGYITIGAGSTAEIPGVGRYDGQTWTNVGGPDLGPNEVYAKTGLAVFDDGSGPALFATGQFVNFGGVEAHGIAKWDGHAWSDVIRGIRYGEDVAAIVVADTPRGRSLLVGGFVINAGGGNVNYVAQYVGCPNCYANCDASTAPPALNVGDFVCFLQRFAARDPLANCDGSTEAQSLTINDFVCFLQKFAAGCG